MIKFIVVVSLFIGGCAGKYVPEVEHVGVLTRSDTHVVLVPVHSTTDVSQSFISSDDIHND